MSRPLITLVTLAVLAASAACGDNVTLPTPGDLGGTWTRTGNVVGSSYVMTLAVADTTVSGTGTFSIEAGASGTMTVSGAVQAPLVQLVILTSIGQKQHFNGTISDSDTMSGSFWTEGFPVNDPIVVTFKRTAR